MSADAFDKWSARFRPASNAGRWRPRAYIIPGPGELAGKSGGVAGPRYGFKPTVMPKHVVV
ncbi:PPE family protein, SVP subgroup [Mycobacterium gordonae]|uniref:PPE family protein, SVP subgroup n=1 Tax=Mycobacterium gordonae TaxID=1778 RepID=UPI0009F34A97